MPWRRRQAVRLLVLAFVLASIVALSVKLAGTDTVMATRHSARRTRHISLALPARRARTMTRTRTIGYSVEHRPIRIVEVGDPRAPHPTLVVGCIHGNETAGIAVARRLAAGSSPRGTALWIIPDLNPDGVAADTRQNARGVDLNRNFPYGWRALYVKGDPQYGGPRPLSEPESRLVHRLILRLQPRLSIWFHQPQGLIDLSGGDARIERRFAQLSGLPLRELTRYPGSATTWQDHTFRDATSFVVELPPGRPSRAQVARFAGAVWRLASETAP
jgi:murein peptide amidase A